MRPEYLIGLLICFLGVLVLARQPRGKLLAITGAIAGTVIALLVIDVRSYVAPVRGDSRAGVIVDAWDFRVLDLNRPIGDLDKCRQLAGVLPFLVRRQSRLRCLYGPISPMLVPDASLK